MQDVKKQTALRPILTGARLDNQKLNLEEFQAGMPVLRSYPLILIVELTRNCNLSCPMCRQGSGYRSEWDMEPGIFNAVAQELFDKAMIIDLRGFGESMLVRQFPEYVRVAADSGAHLRLVTNGQVSREEIWDRLMSVHSSVLISCDAADPELFALLRRGGTIQRLAATATRITHYRDLYSAPADLVSLLTIVSRSNLHDLPNIPSLAANLGISKVSLFPIQVPLDDGRHLASDVDGTRRALDATIERALALGIELHVGAALDIQLALKADVKSLCMHPWAFAYVSHDGGVGFCDQLIGNRKYLLGRLGPDGFLSVWNNENFERLRRSHAHKSISDEFAACRWCYKQRYLEYEHWVYPELQAHYISTLTRDTLYEYDEQAAGERLSFLC